MFTWHVEVSEKVNATASDGRAPHALLKFTVDATTKAEAKDRAFAVVRRVLERDPDGVFFSRFDGEQITWEPA